MGRVYFGDERWPSIAHCNHQPSQCYVRMDLDGHNLLPNHMPASCLSGQEEKQSFMTEFPPYVSQDPLYHPL